MDMYFKSYTFASIAFIVLLVSSCTSFNPVDPNRPIELDCSYATNTTLTNHNPDGVDYIVSCQLEIEDGTFTIESGTIIEFEEGTGIEILQNGIIKAEGISGDPVIFRGLSAGVPSWRGIFVNASQGLNVFNHVEISEAGDGLSYAQFENVTAAITLAGRLSMTNSIIRQSGGVGLFSTEAINNASITEFSDNTIQDCASFPIYTAIHLADNIDYSSCRYEVNGDNVIAFHDFESSRLEEDLQLKALEIPYYIQGVLELRAGLILEAGVDMQMGNNAIIDMSPTNSGTYLSVQGIASNHVTIRGREAISGFWRGIYITQTNAQNIFDYLDISDGGANPLSFSDTKANIALEFNGSLTMNHCTSARSGSSCDVLVHNFGGNPIFEEQDSDLMICTE